VKTLAERAQALEPLGFTPRQAHFLATVALHSGYCLRRQYAAFAGVRHGKNVRDFLDDLVGRRFAVRFLGRADRGHVYHLQARTIYRLLEQPNNRNRRTGSSAALIARKLMLLDHVLTHPRVAWLATEAEKVELFVQQYGVARADLPHQTFPAARLGRAPTVRYFPHKLPIAVAGDPPLAQFVCLATDIRGRSLDDFLRDHAALLRQLPAWTIVAVAPKTSPALTACEHVFARFLGRPSSMTGVRVDDVRWYLTTRRAVDQGEWARLTVADIDRFRLLRERLNTPAFETLYRDWLTRGDAVLDTRRAETPQPAGPTAGRLVTEVLPYDYSQFGSLPGVA
jgi:hypothetical protein